MKEKIILGLLLVSGVLFKAQFVGINKQDAEAILDIKEKDGSNVNDIGDKVLRFSTKPSRVKTEDFYSFFVGKERENGYDLRVATFEDVFRALSKEIPTLRRIVVRNNAEQSFGKSNGNNAVKIQEEIINTSATDFLFNKDTGSIMILKGGIYEVSSWVGFEELPAREGDIILSIAKKSAGETSFTNFKRTVVSRSGVVYTLAKRGSGVAMIDSDNAGPYSVGNGVGSSFAFVEDFAAGDEIRLMVNTTNRFSVKTLPRSVSMSVTRVNK